MRLMFLRILSWLGYTWGSIYLNGRRWNHRLWGFYRYHLDTFKTKASPWIQRCRRFFGPPKWKAALRGLLFWPLMGIAALIIYTEQVPMFTPSLGLYPDQSNMLPSENASVFQLQLDTPVKQFNALPEFTYLSGDDDGPVASSGEFTSDNSVFIRPEASNNPGQVASEVVVAEDEAALVLAGLPRFELTDMLQPLQGEVVRSLGWYRHEVYGDWRMATGLTIEPAQPGAPVLAAYTGVVDQVTKLESNAWSVKLLHQDGWESEYGGLERINVEPGTVVEQGETLGVTADAAESTVAFTLKHYEAPVDTIAYWRSP
jgi:hypothetical protein